MSGIPWVSLGLLGARVLLSRRAGDTSSREEAEAGLSDADDAGDVAIFREALGVPYYWGAGRGEPYPAQGYDCSGYVDSALRAAGYTLPWAASSASTATMSAALGAPRPLAQGEQAPRGAIVAYGSGGKPSHVMLSTGEGVIGASGGGSSTRGDDPSAAVKEFPTAWYRGDLLGYWLLT